jgi:hypothetical protein
MLSSLDIHFRTKIIIPLALCLTDIHLPPTHWATPFTFLEMGVLCEKMIKADSPVKESAF